MEHWADDFLSVSVLSLVMNNAAANAALAAAQAQVAAQQVTSPSSQPGSSDRLSSSSLRYIAPCSRARTSYLPLAAPPPSRTRTFLLDLTTYLLVKQRARRQVQAAPLSRQRLGTTVRIVLTRMARRCEVVLNVQRGTQGLGPVGSCTTRQTGVRRHPLGAQVRRVNGHGGGAERSLAMSQGRPSHCVTLMWFCNLSARPFFSSLHLTTTSYLIRTSDLVYLSFPSSLFQVVHFLKSHYIEYDNEVNVQFVIPLQSTFKNSYEILFLAINSWLHYHLHL